LQYPASAAGLSLLLLLTAAFWAAGLLVPELVPEYPGSRREIIGMALMLIAIPSYFAAAVIAAQNHSVGLVERVRTLLADPSDAEEAARSIVEGFRRFWLVGAFFGVILGLPNGPLALVFAV
jgi:hypothetical protein